MGIWYKQGNVELSPVARWRDATSPHDGDALIRCPYCLLSGGVRTTRGRKKGAISGAKVVAALFTFGASLLVAGLARRDRATDLYCANCEMRWDV